MTCNTFLRSVLFAALAAAGWLPWAMLAGPFVGLSAARAVYVILVTALYVALLSPRHGMRPFPAFVLAGGAAATLALLVAGSWTELATLLALVLGIARGGFFFAGSPARTVGREVFLLAGGLAFARFLGGPGFLPTAFALWGFLLVQSLFFLMPANAPRAGGTIRSDAFEEAYRRALAILERSPV